METYKALPNELFLKSEISVILVFIAAQNWSSYAFPPKANESMFIFVLHGVLICLFSVFFEFK